MPPRDQTCFLPIEIDVGKRQCMAGMQGHVDAAVSISRDAEGKRCDEHTSVIASPVTSLVYKSMLAVMLNRLLLFGLRNPRSFLVGVVVLLYLSCRFVTSSDHGDPDVANSAGDVVINVEADAYAGRVVGIVDGDTIDVLLTGNGEVRVRLASIDCPERGQPFSKRAKQRCSELCFGREVQVVKTGTSYGRWVAFVDVDGEFVQHEMLRSGLAWFAYKYSDDPEMERLEDVARRSRIGLWSDPNPVAPWEWRRERKGRW